MQLSDLSRSNDPVEPDVFVNTGGAARLAGVSNDTIRRWCSAGKLPYRQAGENAQRRIRVRDLFDLLNGWGADPPVKLTTANVTAWMGKWTDALVELLPLKEGTMTDKQLGDLLRALRGERGLAAAVEDLAEEVAAILDRPKVKRSEVDKAALADEDLSGFDDDEAGYRKLRPPSSD